MTNVIGRERFEGMILFKMSPENFKRVMDAYQTSKYAHREQSRDDGVRYFEHPKSVALILIKELGIFDHEMIIAALLHDSVEDTFIFGDIERASDNIKIRFGDWAAKALLLLSKRSCKPDEKTERDAQYFAAIAKADLRTKIIKFADRMHNVRDLKNCTSDKQAKYVKETEGHFLSLADEIILAAPPSLGRKVAKLRAQMASICDKTRAGLD